MCPSMFKDGHLDSYDTQWSIVFVFFLSIRQAFMIMALSQKIIIEKGSCVWVTFGCNSSPWIASYYHITMHWKIFCTTMSTNSHVEWTVPTFGHYLMIALKLWVVTKLRVAIVAWLARLFLSFVCLYTAMFAAVRAFQGSVHIAVFLWCIACLCALFTQQRPMDFPERL